MKALFVSDFLRFFSRSGKRTCHVTQEEGVSSPLLLPVVSLSVSRRAEKRDFLPPSKVLVEYGHDTYTDDDQRRFDKGNLNLLLPSLAARKEEEKKSLRWRRG